MIRESTEQWSVEAAEIAPLLETQQLVQAGAFTVFWMEARQAPRLLDRIAVERELAFRAVGEGTGHDRDRDDFDDRYLHLCAWDHAHQALAGAYRIGVLPLEMLYTSTLFHFDRRMDHLLSPAMELGRAFVRAPYQKQYAALMALWVGIGRLVLTRPDTRYLFGAVSIPATYSPAARALMVAFLRRHALHRQFAQLTTPRHPIPAVFAGAAAQVPDTADVDALDVRVRAIDREGKGVPVLLRQYLRLGARAFAFNIDSAFNDALDVLVAVDLPGAPAALLRRYMGIDGARAYLASHADGRGHHRAA